MKKILLLTIVIICFNNIKAQTSSGVSLEMHYPVVISLSETNDYTELDGVIGGSFNFQFTDNLQYNFGFSYQFDVFQYNYYPNEYVEPTKSGFMMNHINLYSKLLFIDAPELQMKIQGGFSTYKYRKSQTDRSYNGYNAGAGLSYDVSEQLYITGNYSFIHAAKKFNDGSSGAPEVFHIGRIGLGFNF